MPTLVDTRMLGRLTPLLFTDRVTIQSNTPTQSTSGQPLDSWANASGLVNLPCRLSTVGGDETREPSHTYSVNTYVCVIAGLYSITPAQRAVADGVTWDITNVDHDSAGQMTRLALREVTR